MGIGRSRILEFIFLFAIVSTFAHGQTELRVQRAEVSWPEVTLYVKAQCLGNPIPDLRNDHLRINDNTRSITDFTVSCPTPGPHAFSAALVLDASGSMRGDGTAVLREAALTFVGNMDGLTDEAAVIAANGQTQLRQAMTSIRSLLEDAVHALPTSGSSGVYDAMYEGLLRLLDSGGKQSYGVVALVDNDDAVSLRTAGEVVALANQHRFPVHIIAYGGGGSFTDFALLAEATGGYFARVSNATEATSAFMEAFHRLRAGEEYCKISYQAKCPDGAQHDVSVQLLNSCYRTPVGYAQYSAPLDSSVFQRVRIGFPSATMRRASETSLPLLIHAPDEGVWLPPFALKFPYWKEGWYRLRYEFSFSDSRAVIVSMGMRRDTMTLESESPVFVRGTETLLRIYCQAQDQVHATECEVPLFSMDLKGSGCFIPELQSSTLGVVREAPMLLAVELPTQVLSYDYKTERFHPEEIELRYRIKNVGQVSADIEKIRMLSYDRFATLVHPAEDEVIPANRSISPGDSIDFVWTVRPKRPMNWYGVNDFPLEVLFTNYPAFVCRAWVEYPSTQPILDLSVVEWGEVIDIDPVTGRYSPMPIPFHLLVMNTGGHPTGEISVSLEMEGQLALAPPASQLDLTKKLTPSILAPGDTGVVSWEFIHPDVPRFTPVTFRSFVTSTTHEHIQYYKQYLFMPLDSRDSVAVVRTGYLGSVCSADSVTLEAEDHFSSYLWSTGARTRGIVVKATGEYQVRAVNARGDTLSSRVFTIHARPARAVSIEATPPAACEGDTIWLRAVEEFAEYHWSDRRGGRLVPVTSAQPLRVTGTDEFGCTHTSEQYIATFHPRPVKPEIARIADTLLVQTPAARFLWYRDGVLVQDDTQPQFTVEQPGVYHVEAVSTEGCVAVSDPFAVTTVAITAVASPEGLRLEVYPDPASTRMYVTCTTVDASPVEVRLHDMLGRSLDAIRGVASGQRVSFDVSGLPRGSYLITLHTAQGIVARRVGKL